MKTALTMTAILTRLFVVLVMLSSATLQAPAMSRQGVDASTSEISMSHHEAAAGDHAGHAKAHATGGIDHSAAGDGDCSIHCMTALPETATFRTASRIVRRIAYSVLVEDRAGLAVPALDRPPRA